MRDKSVLADGRVLCYVMSKGVVWTHTAKHRYSQEQRDLAENFAESA